jgi:ABC-type glycerol-3-phosphate transport system substrate-binding protein
LQTSKLDWGFDGGPAPAGKVGIGTYGGWNLAIFKSSENKDAAWKYIRFLTRQDVNGSVVDLFDLSGDDASTSSTVERFCQSSLTGEMERFGGSGLN